MKKWLIAGIGGTVVVIAIIVIVGLSNLGPIIKKAVNSYGPDIVKTDLHVDDVGVALFSAEVKIKKFFLGNPAGFKTPSAVKVDSVFMNVDEGSLASDTIIIDRIEVVSPEITYEKKANTDNFSTILKNIGKTADSGKSAEKESAEKTSQKKIIIRNFIIKQGKVNFALPVPGLEGKKINIPLPDIHLKDIGQKSDGISPAKVFKEIFATVYGKITSPGVTDALNQQIKTMGIKINSLGKETAKQLKGGAGKVKKGLDDVSKKLKNILGN